MNHIREIADKFRFCGTNKECHPFGDGHINITYLVINEYEGRTIRYILQRMHSGVAKDPMLLMDNIMRVTKMIQEKNEKCYEKAKQRTMQVILTKTGEPCYHGEDGEWYRAFSYIENTVSYETPKNLAMLAEGGRALGKFQKDLADFKFDPTYYEMTKRFHDTIHRYQLFLEAVKADSYSRAGEVREEIDFYMAHKPQMEALLTLAEEGKLPFRATHNDLRLNNILFDKDTAQAVALVDLDTVTPGLAAYDYGDAMRSMAKEVVYDGDRIVSVGLNLENIKSFTKGYLEVAGEFLEENEMLTLPNGILLLSLELGMRYLTDYLEGDIYFKKNVRGENKKNARREMLFAIEVERNMEDIHGLLSEIRKSSITNKSV